MTSAPARMALARARGGASQAGQPGLERDLDDPAPAGAQRLEIRELVLVALAGEEVGGLVARGRDRRLAERHGAIEPAETRALEVVDQVGGRQEQPIGDQLHQTPLAPLVPRLATASPRRSTAAGSLSACSPCARATRGPAAAIPPFRAGRRRPR